jgi:DNA-binding IscR family transcriptional regulator
MPDCSIRSVWRLVQGAVDQVLGRLSLRDLLCSEEQMSGWKGPAQPPSSPGSRPTA